MTPEDASSGPHLFSSDRPITRRDEDKLGRRAFSEQIARAVRGWKGNDSLVIALYGPWGTGKSSIKNMVIDALRDTPESATVVDFNPWQVASVHSSAKHSLMKSALPSARDLSHR
jgi:predicted KAP-like P-loop ATPase